jgi:hypothetical protein
LTEKKQPKRKQRGPTNRTDHARARAKDKFIDVLAASCNVSEACRAAGIARSTAHDWRAVDAEFMRRWDEAIETAKDALEAEARRRAVEGWQEPVYQQGRQVGTIQRYSDRMLEVLLKGHKPQFRERSDVTVGVTIPQPQQPVDLEATARRLAVLFRRVRSEMEADDLRKRLLPAERVVSEEENEK